MRANGSAVLSVGLLALGGVLAASLSVALSLAAEPATPKPIEPNKPIDSKPAPVPANHAKSLTQGLKVFKETVRPLLIQHCLECHGGKSTKAEFDLATREDLFKGGLTGPGVVPGQHRRSLLWQVTAHVEEPHMPLKKPKLPQESLDAIARWIDDGAPYDAPLIDKGEAAKPKEMVVTDKDRAFWSMTPLHTAEKAPGAGQPDGWSRGEIDRFVLARLREAGLKPNPVADRRTLIRRAYLDAWGLPPTPEEVDRFVADQDPAAYDKLVDRLLASPRFAERWAPHWLDVARFAESDGFEHDYFRPHAYAYRDFVIRAIHEDLPYDRFVHWQLAGDEAAPDNPMALAATGFLSAGVFPTQITEKEFESTRYDQLDDMVSTTSLAFLGLTVGCARCHDHKYDAFPAHDYYAMAACFATAIRNEVEVDLTTPEDRQAFLAQAGPRIQAIRQELARLERDVFPARFAQRLAEVKDGGEAAPAPWRVLAFESIKTQKGAKLTPQPDGSLLLTGAAPDKDAYVLTSAFTQPATLTALRLEALTHASLPHRGPGAAGNGNFALSELIVAHRAAGAAKDTVLKLERPLVTHEQNRGDLSIASTIDGHRRAGWAVDFGGIGKDQAAVLHLATPLKVASGDRLTVTLHFDNGGAHLLGRPRLCVSSDPMPPLLAPAQESELATAWRRLAKGEALPEALDRQLREDFAARQPEAAPLRAELASLEKGPPRKNTKIQITSEGLPPVKNHADGRGYPHFYPTVHHLARGDVAQKLAPAQPSYLQVLMRDGKTAEHWRLSPKPGQRTSLRRLALAQWITDTRHGGGALAARVIVNRVWQHHLGRGIVGTPNDFGLQSDAPTHPELLEHLARELVEGGWRLKAIHRAVMTSAVYMQSSAYDSERAAKDAGNHLLWRFAPRRLEAEPIRDAMLSVAGLLDERMYGPGTLNEGMTRRSVYFTVKRAELVTGMLLFDWPERLVSIGARPVTTVSPQALLLVNGGQARRCGEAMGASLMREHGERLEAVVDGAYRRALGRLPDDSERALAVSFIRSQRAERGGAAAAYASAVAEFCQAILGSNEFVYIP